MVDRNLPRPIEDGELAVVEGDVLDVALVAVDDARHTALAAHGAGAALAGARARGRLDLADLLSHGADLLMGIRAPPLEAGAARNLAGLYWGSP